MFVYTRRAIQKSSSSRDCTGFDILHRSVSHYFMNEDHQVSLSAGLLKQHWTCCNSNRWLSWSIGCFVTRECQFFSFWPAEYFFYNFSVFTVLHVGCFNCNKFSDSLPYFLMTTDYQRNSVMNCLSNQQEQRIVLSVGLNDHDVHLFTCVIITLNVYSCLVMYDIQSIIMFRFVFTLPN